MKHSPVILVLTKLDRALGRYLQKAACAGLDGSGLYEVDDYYVVRKICDLNTPYVLRNQALIGNTHLQRAVFMTEMGIDHYQSFKTIVDEAIREQENQNDESFF